MLVSSIMTTYLKIHLPLIDSKMFFHPAAVSDATAQSLLFHVHVSVTAVGSDQCPYKNGLPRPRSRSGQLAGQDYLQQIVPQQKKIDNPIVAYIFILIVLSE